MTEGRSLLMTMLSLPPLHTGSSLPPPPQPALKATSKLKAANCLLSLTRSSHQAHTHHLLFNLASLAGWAGTGHCLLSHCIRWNFWIQHLQHQS